MVTNYGITVAHQPPDSDQFWCDVNLTSKCVTMDVATQHTAAVNDTVYVAAVNIKSWTVQGEFI